ncbi:hypothetical protein BOTBODRAFT_170248 [Botryobasidium botryosum FD-172 SS1]|uniref:rRNA-processing protein EFG1 n=1 Tax=Botryobasidium botryosum (strain FD-172 SS1) TaxID=930990 RepID=A0A067N807_BOTB1|nr:hypothetical protein BOTBODRAFT_170248 [Botryobasidium botryosum FD-172 SS1]
MAPTRSQKSTRAASSSTPESRLPSVGKQKLKSSIRQAKRLLAKDKLGANIRVETERRLKSLESDLRNAERADKERAFAEKYRKVKFFDRRKIVRKIAQAKKSIASSSTPAKELPALHESLLAHRVDLNYVLHYPKTQKYIALYPSAPSTEETQGATNKTRDELRTRVRKAMEKGEMDQEPELTMNKWHNGAGLESEERVFKKKDGKQEEKSGIAKDEFFGDDDDDEEEE